MPPSLLDKLLKALAPSGPVNPAPEQSIGAPQKMIEVSPMTRAQKDAYHLAEERNYFAASAYHPSPCTTIGTPCAADFNIEEWMRTNAKPGGVSKL